VSLGAAETALAEAYAQVYSSPGDRRSMRWAVHELMRRGLEAAIAAGEIVRE